MMGDVRVGLVEATPAKEGASPVAFSCFVGGDELVEVDGSVGFVLCIGAVGATVVGETGGDGDAGSCEKHGLVVRRCGRRRRGMSSSCKEEVRESNDGTGDGGGGGRDYDRWW